DRDLLEYEVHLVDAQQRKVLAGPLVRTSLAPRVTWSVDAKSFVVFDACSEKLWRVSPDLGAVSPVDLTHVAGRAVRRYFPHPIARWHVLELLDRETSSVLLLHGWWTPEGPMWDKLNVVEGASFDCPRWRPGARELVCVRQEKRRVRLELLDFFGGTLAS